MPTTTPSRSLTATLRPLWGGLALVVLYNGLLAAWLALRPAPSPVIQAVDNVAQCVGPLLSLPLCWWGLAWPWRRGREGEAGTVTAASRWMPVLLGLGVLGYAVGQVIWTYYQEVIHQPPFPSWADAGYLAAYPFLFAGLLLLPRRPLPSAVRLRVLLDGVMIMTGVVAFSWYFVLGPTVLQGSESLFGQLVGAAYPFCDLVLFFCLLLLWGRAQERALRPVVVLFSLGLGCILVIDTAFAYGNLHGTYATGGVVDAGWPLGYMLIALATRAARQALAHAAREGQTLQALTASAPTPPLWRALLPYAFLPAVGALVVSTGHLRDATPLEKGVWIGAGVLGAVVVLRQVVALLETRQLYRQVEERNQALAAANARLETLASTDPLTGLLNHRAFHARLDEEIARAERGGRPLALLLVDLDDFRAINNTYGHQAGDRALVAIAAALRASLRAGDSAGRLGGDEFAALLPEADLSEALAVAERARAAVAGIALPADAATIRATTSLGVAALPRHARTRDALIAAADQAAYAAKDAGKDCVRASGEPPRLALVGRA
jgi:two-component system cell cycle response regulator